MILYPNLFIIAKLSTLFTMLAYSLNVNASSKVGVTDFAVYDRFDGKYDIYALHVFAGRPGSQVLKFHICGQVYEKSTSAMGTKFKIDR
ncbi:hypothetical protein CWB99_23425 [Pseudoalteromonas rubra]|uniref:Uncharacterized protein n=1 Tax=Pseudoalteromonas rubra TaxID=43658 RepID=A0A5S3WEY0_9GAMM|nr:hypothetical protein CWB99_23425 [Pseudoalteromonas rubra]TMP27160.1 hypothetical protein CWC00_23555 [Pseudoalteromonas rubra]